MHRKTRLDDGFIQLIYKAIVDGSVWYEVLDTLREETGAAGAMLMSVRGGKVDWIATPVMRDAMEHYVGDNWHPRNPRLARPANLIGAGFLTDADVALPDQIREHPFYTRGLKRTGMGWALGALIALPTGDAMLFHLERAFAAGPFTPEHRAKLESLRGHIEQSTSIIAQRLIDRSHVALDVLAKLDMNAVVITEDGSIVGGTPSLAPLTDTGAPMAVLAGAEGRRLVNRAFELQSDRAAPDGLDGSRRPLVGTREIAGSTYELDAIPLTDRSVFSAKTALLVLRPVTTTQPVDPKRVAERHHLTMVETEIAVMIAGGLAVEDIARHRACGVSTVRWHLKSVFVKLGISRQAELVRLFTAGMA